MVFNMQVISRSHVIEGIVTQYEANLGSTEECKHAGSRITENIHLYAYSVHVELVLRIVLIHLCYVYADDFS